MDLRELSQMLETDILTLEKRVFDLMKNIADLLEANQAEKITKSLKADL